ncbi:quinone-dependent dihydroorotate dehydrogenase [Maricaulis sp. D1M11]|uniref:quinone-dependent dihydroorotate dehydrogenase n=1 Tax=Maricaulis sp. D1M11 TaxID=3076117 RepID=UPI0039B38FAD
MINGFYGLATRALHVLDGETAHGVSLAALKAGLGPRQTTPDHACLATSVAGLSVSNPLGLAAGYDKNGEVADAMLATGFGFVECGAVTPRPQAGNPKPRVFRLSADRAVINRMGFNNDGLDVFTQRMQARSDRGGVVGVNLGANKDSEDRPGDYVKSLKALDGLCQFFTVNISSPNTPGLRDLQSADALDELLARVADARGQAPVFLKLAPDISDSSILDMVEAVRRHGLDGLILSNTTLARPDSLCSSHAGEAGGLSGRPLFQRSTQLLKAFREAAGPDMPIIGVGGVEDAETAWAKIRAGANLVQLYSALVYKGPGLVGEIKRGLVDRLQAEGFSSVSEAVGTL